VALKELLYETRVLLGIFLDDAPERPNGRAVGLASRTRPRVRLGFCSPVGICFASASISALQHRNEYCQARSANRPDRRDTPTQMQPIHTSSFCVSPTKSPAGLQRGLRVYRRSTWVCC